MTDERDPKVSRRYRELGPEEPPRELDQAILAAAHRAADRAHAPLVAPAGRHRWYFAFGAAAILVLAVAITVQLDRQPFDPEALPAASAPAVSERKEDFSANKVETPSGAREPREEAPAKLQKQPGPKPPPSPARDATPLQERPRTQNAPAAAPAVPPPAPSAHAERRDAPSGAATGLFYDQAAPSREAAARPQAKVQESRVVASMAAPLAPEQLLERIAELRKEGRQDEADKALEEFRKQYPDYRISEEMLKKVERPK